MILKMCDETVFDVIFRVFIQELLSKHNKINYKFHNSKDFCFEIPEYIFIQLKRFKRSQLTKFNYFHRV